jgi:deazaflavin-dependent oxidoreductase (nitroreductase family)
MPAVRRTKLTELFWRVHPWLYRATGGLVGGRVMGMPVLLLTTTRRRTGTPRTRALMYLPKGEACVVIASYAGEPRHPDWWLNLRAHPTAQIQRGRTLTAVRAREADGEERARLWAEVVERERGYATYAERATRRIPVVVLEPVTVR